MRTIYRDVDPPEPPLCDECGAVCEPGTTCDECGEPALSRADIEDLRAEAAIARAEDERMFPQPDDDREVW